MKPVVNLDELEFATNSDGPFQEKYSGIGEKIGAKKLGCNLTVVPPGKRANPFHNHRINEELFFILEGTGVLRFGQQEYPLRPHDVISCPAGERTVAHQIINTGETELKYLALSTLEPHEIVEYPDSNKVGVYVGDWSDRNLKLLFRAEQAVDYFDREY